MATKYDLITLHAFHSLPVLSIDLVVALRVLTQFFSGEDARRYIRYTPSPLFALSLRYVPFKVS